MTEWFPFFSLLENWISQWCFQVRLLKQGTPNVYTLQPDWTIMGKKTIQLLSPDGINLVCHSSHKLTRKFKYYIIRVHQPNCWEIKCSTYYMKKTKSHSLCDCVYQRLPDHTNFLSYIRQLGKNPWTKCSFCPPIKNVSLSQLYAKN